MLDSIGNCAGIELPDGLKDCAGEWLYSFGGGYRVMLRMRGSHSDWLADSKCTLERRHLKPIVRGTLGEENTGNRVFWLKYCCTHAKKGDRRCGASREAQVAENYPGSAS